MGNQPLFNVIDTLEWFRIQLRTETSHLSEELLAILGRSQDRH